MLAGLTDPFERQDEDAIERAAGDIYVIANNTDESANTSTPDPSLAGRMATEAGNNETRAPTQGEAGSQGFWAAPGNAFGLGAIQEDWHLHGTHIESVSSNIPSLCVECLAPTVDDGTGSIRCGACANQARRIGRMRSSMAAQASSMVTNGMVALAAMHMAVQAARASRAHAPTTTISIKYIGLALAVALLAVSISGARGEAYGDETLGRNTQ